MRTRTLLLVAAASVAALASCGERRPPPTAGRGRVLATVNGVQITDLDVEQRAKGPAGTPGHDVNPNVLQTLVRDELLFQKGVQLGLDREPGYREKVDALQAQVRAFERQAMGELVRVWVRGQASVTDAEVRAYFDENAAFIRTRWHVLQILHRGTAAEIAGDRDAVKGGTPFEEVAARRFPAQPPGSKPPWDLGELAWVQVPQPWRGVVDRLEPGQVSDVIQGPNERFWIVKLVGKTVDPAITFDTEKERIGALLRERKAAALYEQSLADMKAKATIVYAKRNGPAGSHP